MENVADTKFSILDPTEYYHNIKWKERITGTVGMKTSVTEIPF